MDPSCLIDLRLFAVGDSGNGATMSSSHFKILQSLSRDPAGRGELKHALARLSSELKDRTDKGSISSMEFFVAAFGAISKIRGPANADIRFEALINCGLYFYRT